MRPLAFTRQPAEAAARSGPIDTAWNTSGKCVKQFETKGMLQAEL